MSIGVFSSRRLVDEWRGVRGGVSTGARAVDEAIKGGGSCTSVLGNE